MRTDEKSTLALCKSGCFPDTQHLGKVAVEERGNVEKHQGLHSGYVLLHLPLSKSMCLLKELGCRSLSQDFLPASLCGHRTEVSKKHLSDVLIYL